MGQLICWLIPREGTLTNGLYPLDGGTDFIFVKMWYMLVILVLERLRQEDS